MIKLIHFLMQQKLFVNLLVVLIIISGYFTMKTINREAIPEVNFDMVTIKTVYPGASPDELEQLISMPIEKKLRKIDDIDKVRTYNIENVSVVVVYIEPTSADKKKVAQDIKDAVELVDNLPEKAFQPIVEELNFETTPLVELAIFGKNNKISYSTVRDIADELEDFLYDIEGVAEVEQFGYYDREYLVEVNPDSLKKYRLGINKVIRTLKTRNLDLPGGSLRVGDKEFVLRTKAQYKNIDEIRNTVIMANDAGFVTRIKDVAKVTYAFEEADVLERFNGREAIVFKIWKKRSADELKLNDVIQESVGKFQAGHSGKIKLKFFNNLSDITNSRISSLFENGISGFILLALILIALLKPRMAGIVMTSIPVAFMTAFLGMKYWGITINVISMFGMIMVLGMIVDFAIVVSENGHRYLEKGITKVAAIEAGVAEVFWPLTITLLCICAAFAPLLLLSGILGKFIKGIPIVLMICLVAAWYGAMFILPTHLNLFAKSTPEHAESQKLEDENYEVGFFGKIQSLYKIFLNLVLKFRYIMVVLLIVMLAFSFVLAKKVGFVFMPAGGERKLKIKFSMPLETNLQANLREIKKIEKIALKLPKEELEAVHSRVGLESSIIIDPKPGQGSHKTTILVYLTDEEDRDRTADQILAQLREEILNAQQKGIISKKVVFLFNLFRGGPEIGKPVNVEIRGNDFLKLEKLANSYINYLKTVNGVSDITMDLEMGKQEYRYMINEVMSARTKVSVQDVAMSLNASFEGAVASSAHKGDEEIDIRVRFPEKARKRLNSLNEVMIANKSGGLIPISLVTQVKKQPGYSQINRLNYRRLVQVQANVDTDIITSDKINRMLAEKFHDIERRNPGYLVSYGGEKEERDESMSELGMLFTYAILVIFVVLAVFFESLILPVVVMIAIPFSFVGVALAFWIHGQPLSFMATLGLFSLAGIIVSNTLVLVQFINNLRDQGLSLKEALLEGGVIRLRPVILTAGTTVLALFPAIYSLGGKDYFIQPLSLAFGYGLIFATFITLILIPSFYHIAEDMKGGVARLLSFAGINIRGEIYDSKDMESIEEESKPKEKKSERKK